MINGFSYYLSQGKAKRQTPDPKESESLLTQARDRLSYIKARPITAASARFVLQDAYESIREAAQSLMSRQGYKPYSHEATISFVRAYHADAFAEQDIRAFDRFRILRNDSVYKAVQITVDEAAQCLVFADIFVEKVGMITL